MTSGVRYLAVPQNVLIVFVPALGAPFAMFFSKLGDWGTPLVKNSLCVLFGVREAIRKNPKQSFLVND